MFLFLRWQWDGRRRNVCWRRTRWEKSSIIRLLLLLQVKMCLSSTWPVFVSQQVSRSWIFSQVTSTLLLPPPPSSSSVLLSVSLPVFLPPGAVEEQSEQKSSTPTGDRPGEYTPELLLCHWNQDWNQSWPDLPDGSVSAAPPSSLALSRTTKKKVLVAPALSLSLGNCDQTVTGLIKTRIRNSYKFLFYYSLNHSAVSEVMI